MNDKVAASRAVRSYMLFSFAGLLGMVVVLLLKGMDLWSLFPLILGAMSLLAYWRAGPVFMLTTLAVLVTLRARGLDPLTCMQLCLEYGSIPLMGASYSPSTPLLDFLLSVCVLLFLVGHYRLQGLVHNVVPPDLRTQGAPRRGPVRSLPIKANPRRAPGVLPKWELALLVLAAFVSVFVAEYVMNYFHTLRPGLDLSLRSWQALMLIWFSGLILFLAWALFGYVGRCRATREESLLYLQDQLWRQTRREQSMLNRWLAWARLRWQRHKGEVR